MKRKKAVFLPVFLLVIVFTLPGCWNYREVEKFAIVSGFAVDKNEGGYSITFEIINVKAGKDAKISTSHVTTEGPTIFDAARKTINLTGKRLYFSQAEIIIISKDVAEEGIIPVLDWVSRDAEPRFTLHFIVSKEKTAKEILEQEAITTDILSYELNEMLNAQKSTATARDVEEWQFMTELAAMGISATLPSVYLINDQDRVLPKISGTAVFKEDKLVGFLDGEETKAMLFVKDKINSGVLVNPEHNNNSTTWISLEILKSKTKLKPRYSDGKIIIDIYTDTNVALDENAGRNDYSAEPLLAKLKKDFGVMLENNIENLVKKTQEEFNSDIFGFGQAVRLSMPKYWKQIEPQWGELYKSVEVEVHSTINVKNSAYESKPVKVGD